MTDMLREISRALRDDCVIDTDSISTGNRMVMLVNRQLWNDWAEAIGDLAVPITTKTAASTTPQAPDEMVEMALATYMKEMVGKNYQPAAALRREPMKAALTAAFQGIETLVQTLLKHRRYPEDRQDRSTHNAAIEFAVAEIRKLWP